jgi:DNA repair protein RadC
MEWLLVSLSSGSDIQAAGESLGVPLADHLVLGGDRYHSFRAAEGWDQR